MHIIKNRQIYGKLYIRSADYKTLAFVANATRDLLAKITGVVAPIEIVDGFKNDLVGLAFIVDEKVKSGFSVNKTGTLVTVSGATVADVYFGAMDVVEKNAGVIFSRGAREEELVFSETDSFEIKIFDYAESSPFLIRSFNICGIGSSGESHVDDGTVECFARNKINAITHLFKEEWREYGLKGSALHFSELNNIDDLMEEHPEYFMTDTDGSPKKALGGHDSFMNYYNEGVAKAFALRLVGLFNKMNPSDDVIWVMPDNPYFHVVENGKTLSELPFTADDGTIVYPNEKEYKSTVYFNFLNRAMAEANKIRPNTYLTVFAYTYSEIAPKIKVDSRIRVMLAPIKTNDRYSYLDKDSDSNAPITENIIRWFEKTDNLGVYTYWNSFKGTIYSRPILRVVKENLQFLKKLGVKQIIVEGKVDCSFKDRLSEPQRNAIKFYDMNEAYIWALQKLLWNPDLDIDQLMKRYVSATYKESAPDMLEYFRLIEKGWENTDAMVWYTTGGDIYYLQMIINVGVDKEILRALDNAVKKAVDQTVKRKVSSIRETVKGQIDKYKDFVKEQAVARITSTHKEKLLSPEQMDYVFNPDSEWNKAVPITVLRNYDTFEFYPKEAKFSCRMLYDSENFYVGYTVFDDSLEKAVLGEDGGVRVYRADGTEMESYAETYIGGNVFNQSVYYGYISGFNGQWKKDGQFFVNAGTPKGVPLPKGACDVKFVNLAKDKQKRYCFHVQVIPISALDVDYASFKPYGSFVYYTDRYGRAGWQGFGLWSKQNFSQFTLINKENDDG